VTALTRGNFSAVQMTPPPAYICRLPGPILALVPPARANPPRAVPSLISTKNPAAQVMETTLGSPRTRIFFLPTKIPCRGSTPRQGTPCWTQVLLPRTRLPHPRTPSAMWSRPATRAAHSCHHYRPQERCKTAATSLALLNRKSCPTHYCHCHHSRRSLGPLPKLSTFQQVAFPDFANLRFTEQPTRELFVIQR